MSLYFNLCDIWTHREQAHLPFEVRNEGGTESTHFTFADAMATAAILSAAPGYVPYWVVYVDTNLARYLIAAFSEGKRVYFMTDEIEAAEALKKVIS